MKKTKSFVVFLILLICCSLAIAFKTLTFKPYKCESKFFFKATKGKVVKWINENGQKLGLNTSTFKPTCAECNPEEWLYAEISSYNAKKNINKKTNDSLVTAFNLNMNYCLKGKIKTTKDENVKIYIYTDAEGDVNDISIEFENGNIKKIK